MHQPVFPDDCPSVVQKLKKTRVTNAHDEERCVRSHIVSTISRDACLTISMRRRVVLLPVRIPNNDAMVGRLAGLAHQPSAKLVEDRHLGKAKAGAVLFTGLAPAINRNCAIVEW